MVWELSITEPAKSTAYKQKPSLSLYSKLFYTRVNIGGKWAIVNTLSDLKKC